MKSPQLSEYKALIENIPYGKRLPQAIYIHSSLLEELPPEYGSFVDDAARIAEVAPDAFNIIKFDTSAARISLLHYPAFFEDGFPAQERSWAIDLLSRSVSARSYDDDANRPILHRKETFLSPNHPAQRELQALTAAAQDAGLLEDSHEIGHKHAWEEKLRRIGLAAVGNHLIDIEEASIDKGQEILRHKTALVRYSLSSPMQQLWKHGYLNGNHTVFDYGCGRGDDVRAIAGRGIDASGWDPHFAPENSKVPADVINLGFVLNVIEDPRERMKALEGAWALTKKVLSIAVIIGGKSTYEQHRLYKDGVVTTRGTFQKYFSQYELREFVSDVLDREPVSIAPGILFAFKDDEEEQSFLAARQTAHGPSTSIPRVPDSDRPRGRTRKPSKWDTHIDLVECYWNRCLELGRPPEIDELDKAAEIRENLGTFKTVFRRCVERYGDEQLQGTQERRQADRLVYLALNLFEHRRSFSALPESIRRDVKAFWGAFSVSTAEAKKLLFSAGDPEVISNASQKAVADNLGYLEGGKALYFHSSQILELPPVLRIYLGCAERVYGEFGNADRIKIHIGADKVSLMTYDDFEGKAIPLLQERVKIILGRADYQLFTYGGEYSPQPLYLKSRYLPEGFPHRDAQKSFDDKLENLDLFDFSGFLCGQ